MAMPVQGQVGPRTMQDGGAADLRQSRTGDLVVCHGHGRFYEPSSRGSMFAVSTVNTGTTVVTANASPVGAAAASLLSLYNPTGSGINAVVLRTIIGTISGTPGAGCFSYNMAWGQTLTETQNNGGTSGAPPAP